MKEQTIAKHIFDNNEIGVKEFTGFKPTLYTKMTGAN
jgi:hypothetical protein